MNNSEALVTSLLTSYQHIQRERGNTPDWAVRKRNTPDDLVIPTIPFVGKEYAEQKHRLLVYGSAENLSDYSSDNSDSKWVGDWLANDEVAINRHRNCFNGLEGKNNDFFPHVHLGPIDNGCLATAAFYIALKCKLSSAKTPREFYEAIAFANYGKYSIETPCQKSLRLGMDNNPDSANRDYAGRKSFLKESHAFLQTDLDILNPDYIILPRTISQTDKAFLSEHFTGTLIPIYQINARVINRWIAPKHPQYLIENLPDPVCEWYLNLQNHKLPGMNWENYLAVFSYLDSVLKHIPK